MSTCEIKIKMFIPEAIVPNPEPLSQSTFEGDNRGFSFDGSYRGAQYIKVDLSDFRIMTNMAMTGDTCENVPEQLNNAHTVATIIPAHKRYGKASADRIKLEDVKVEDDILYFKSVAAVRNPLISNAPDMDYEMSFTVTRNGRVCVAGNHDGCPNYEVWIRKDDQKPVMLYGYDHGKESFRCLYGPMDKTIPSGTCCDP